MLCDFRMHTANCGRYEFKPITKLLIKEKIMAQEKGIDSLMTEDRTFPPPDQIKANAHINSEEQYQKMWEQSINDPDSFWLEQAKSLHWFKEPTRSLECSWDTQSRKIEHTWFADGQLIVSYNCLDRHLGTPVA